MDDRKTVETVEISRSALLSRAAETSGEKGQLIEAVSAGKRLSILKANADGAFRYEMWLGINGGVLQAFELDPETPTVTSFFPGESGVVALAKLIAIDSDPEFEADELPLTFADPQAFIGELVEGVLADPSTPATGWMVREGSEDESPADSLVWVSGSNTRWAVWVSGESVTIDNRSGVELWARLTEMFNGDRI